MTPSVRMKSCLAVLMLSLLLVHHFLFVIATNLPTSPLTVDLDRNIQRYIYPYFAQRWNFFAPQPIERTFSLIARAGYVDDRTHEPSATPWSDISKPLVDQVRESRFAPLSLVQLGLANTVVEYMGILSRTKSAIVADPHRSGKYVLKSPVPMDVAPLDRLYLTRSAAASLETEYPHLHISRIQLAISIHSFPRFNHRFEKDDPNQTAVTFLDWQPMPSVSAFTQAGTE